MAEEQVRDGADRPEVEGRIDREERCFFVEDGLLRARVELLLAILGHDEAAHLVVLAIVGGFPHRFGRVVPRGELLAEGLSFAQSSVEVD